jgi:hypothetical protein
MQLVRPIKRQEVPAASKRRHPRIGYQRAVMLALGGPRPILVAPNQQHWNFDTAVIFGRSFPALRVSEQTKL